MGGIPNKRKRSKKFSGSDRPAVEKDELSSPFSVSLPPDFDHLVGMTEEEKIEFANAVLSKPDGESEAIQTFIAPIGKRAKDFSHLFEVYRPCIQVLHDYFCHVGRPKINPQTGKRMITWKEIVQIHFPVGLRQMQNLLAAPTTQRGGMQKLPESQAQTALKKLVTVLADSVEPPAARYEKAVSMAQSIFDSETIDFNANVQVGGLAFAELMEKSQVLIKNFEKEAKSVPAGYTLTDDVGPQIHASRQQLAEHLDKLGLQEKELRSTLNTIHRAIARGRRVDDTLKVLQDTLRKAAA